MRGKLVMPLLVTVSFCWAGAIASAANGSGDMPRMTIEELQGKIGDPDLVIVDVRTEGAWKDSEFKIRGALREDPTGVQNWINKYPKDKTLVFYCS